MTAGTGLFQSRTAEGWSKNTFLAQLIAARVAKKKKTHEPCGRERNSLSVFAWGDGGCSIGMGCTTHVIAEQFDKQVQCEVL